MMALFRVKKTLLIWGEGKFSVSSLASLGGLGTSVRGK